MSREQLKKQNFLSVDEKTAINSYGDIFTIGDIVKYSGKTSRPDAEAVIDKFELNKVSNEVKCWVVFQGDTWLWAHIDFIHLKESRNDS